MAKKIFKLLVLLALCLLTPSRTAADSPEAEGSFNAAVRAFQDGFHERAERELEAFAAAHPESPRVPQAILTQAQSRFHLGQFEPVAELLKSRLAEAAELGDQYRFWIAESDFQRGAFAAAAQFYGELLDQFPASGLRLYAAYGKAFSAFKIGSIEQAIELLSLPDGAFQTGAQANPKDPAAIRGNLLLGESLILRKELGRSEEVLQKLAEAEPPPELEWERLFLLATLELAEAKPDAALARCAKLIELSRQSGKPDLEVRALKFQARIQEAHQPDAAVQTYEQLSMARGSGAVEARNALLKAVELTIVRDQLPGAIRRLESFLTNSLPAENRDLFRLTLGELHLKQFHATPAGATNGPALRAAALQQARTQFDSVIAMTNSPLAGHAFLNRGWSLWQEAVEGGGAPKWTESMAAFQAAVERLEKSDSQATARFKVADCHFELKDYPNAIGNYQAVLDTYSDLVPVRERLFDQALHQLIRCGLAGRDLELASRALTTLINTFPKSALGDRSLLLVGEALAQAGKADEARATLEQLQSLFPESPLAAEARLSLARSFVRESNWPAAIAEYDNWINAYTNHSARAQTEFDRAWVHYRSGNDAAAHQLFTNFVARFPSSQLAPLAQFWVADHHFSRQEFQLADLHYQYLLQHTNVASLELGYRARLMAGKAAFHRQGYNDARRYLSSLIEDAKCPPELQSEAWFILGDLLIEEPLAPGTTNNLVRFENAIAAFSRIRHIPGNRLEPLARGRVGSAYLQLATQNPAAYDQATNEFHQVIALPTADITARSHARVGLGLALERLAEHRPHEQKRLLQRALDAYLDVVYANGLRPGEQPDIFWVKEAGLAAGRLAERLQANAQAIKVYERLRADVPALRDTMDKRLEALQRSANR